MEELKLTFLSDESKRSLGVVTWCSYIAWPPASHLQGKCMLIVMRNNIPVIRGADREMSQEQKGKRRLEEGTRSPGERVSPCHSYQGCNNLSQPWAGACILSP